jgi:hypothetical protein
MLIASILILLPLRDSFLFGVHLKRVSELFIFDGALSPILYRNSLE